MLSSAAGFWSLFWAIMGAAALVTVALAVLIATISPAGSRPHRGHQLPLAPADLAGQQPGEGYPKAA